MTFIALGPILPFISVIGKQLGISEVAMGMIYAVVPAFYFPAKVLFGFIMDCFVRQRTCIFTTTVYLMGCFYLLIYFVPHIPLQKKIATNDVTCLSTLFCDLHVSYSLPIWQFRWSYSAKPDGRYSSVLRYFYVDLYEYFQRYDSPNWTVNQICSLSCKNGIQENDVELTLMPEHCSNIDSNEYRCANVSKVNCNVSCEYMSPVSFVPLNDLYKSTHFWLFCLFVSLGLIGFNVVNTASDTLCFNALGMRVMNLFPL